MCTARFTARCRKRFQGMKRFEKPILVTRPYLPPIEEFEKGLEEI